VPTYWIPPVDEADDWLRYFVWANVARLTLMLTHILGYQSLRAKQDVEITEVLGEN
jgi:hypothetical protein